MPWDLLVASALYSFIATSWRQEAQRPDGIVSAWFVAGSISVGSVMLLVLIAVKVYWWFSLLCIVASFVGQIVLYPFLDRILKSVPGLWAGVIALIVIGVYMVSRIFGVGEDSPMHSFPLVTSEIPMLSCPQPTLVLVGVSTG